MVLLINSKIRSNNVEIWLIVYDLRCKHSKIFGHNISYHFANLETNKKNVVIEDSSCGHFEHACTSDEPNYLYLI